MISTDDPVTLIDLVLGGGVLFSAGVALWFRRPRAQVMGFLGLGVMLPLMWLRLGSVDIAIAEAILGAGLLTAILVTLVVNRASERAPTDVQTAGSSSATQPIRKPPSRFALALIGAGSAAVVSASAVTVWLNVAHSAPQWSDLIAEPMVALGLDHDVTAVLLAYRSYDTLLETAVLMLAGIVVFTLLSQHPGLPVQAAPTTRSLVLLRWFVGIVGPLLALVGLWLLFSGSSGPGGAFQAGATLASVLVLFHLARVPSIPRGRLWLRISLVAGVIAFVLAGLVGPALGSPWLAWPQEFAFSLILAVEIMLTVGITGGLFLLYLGLVTGPVHQRLPREAPR